MSLEQDSLPQVLFDESLQNILQKNITGINFLLKLETKTAEVTKDCISPIESQSGIVVQDSSWEAQIQILTLPWKFTW